MSERMQELVNVRENVRNMSVIAHVDHGKTTLTDSLISRAGKMNEKTAGTVLVTDTDKMEKEKGITIKSTAISLMYDLPEEAVKGIPNAKGSSFLVNLIDSPGHVDFNSEVTAALRVTDGALVVVDCLEGPKVQTETVLRQALAERIKPILMVNKLDRAFLEKKEGSEEIYQRVRKVIESLNMTISTYEDPKMGGDLAVDPTKGTVAFGSGLHGWGFTLHEWAVLYEKKLGVKRNKMMRILWGDNFYDPKNKSWSKTMHTDDGRTLKRAFCEFVLDPLQKIITSINNGEKATYEKLFNRLDIKLDKEDQELEGKPLVKAALKKFLPVGNALVLMICKQLPCPLDAQRYRVENLYSGELDDAAAEAVRKCDKDGPLMVYICKMVPMADNSRFYAFGRVFSGTLKTGSKVRILADKTKPVWVKLSGLAIQSAAKFDSIEYVPAGCTVALMGIDKYMSKSGTITDSEEACAFVDMKFTVSPVVRISVQPSKASLMSKFVDGLKKLGKSDPMVQVQTSESGEFTIAGAGELHVEMCVAKLEEFLGFTFNVGRPTVLFRETIIEKSDRTCLAKSSNKHNRIYMEAEPLEEPIIEALEEGDVLTTTLSTNKRIEILRGQFGYDASEAKNLWAFGPEIKPANAVINASHGVQYVNEIKDHVVSGFHFTSAQGPLSGSVCRGVKWQIVDAELHADTIHRGGGQIIPATNRVLMSSMLAASPRLMEPFYTVSIQCTSGTVGSVYSLVSRRRGRVESETQREGTPLIFITCLLPVLESFGFDSELRGATGGVAFTTMNFSHYELMTSDPYSEGSLANVQTIDTRERGGLKSEIPVVEDYNMKL